MKEMLQKTSGIVFRFTRYGDTSIIVNIFTELFGLQSYIVNGVRSSAARGKMALYQPLNLLEMVVYYHENRSIKRIKEVKCFHPYHSIPTDVRKSAIAMILDELLNKCVKDDSHSRELYHFMAEALIQLDNLTEGFENFHLVFMIRLSRLLGFGIHSVEDVSTSYLAEEAAREKFSRLIHADFADQVPVSLEQRRIILDLLLKFYASHFESLGEFKSVAVLREVFAE